MQGTPKYRRLIESTSIIGLCLECSFVKYDGACLSAYSVTRASNDSTCLFSSLIFRQEQSAEVFVSSVSSRVAIPKSIQTADAEANWGFSLNKRIAIAGVSVVVPLFLSLMTTGQKLTWCGGPYAGGLTDARVLVGGRPHAYS